eukprot:15447656-Alexandrium_andersonii.AAC.1
MKSKLPPHSTSWASLMVLTFSGGLSRRPKASNRGRGPGAGGAAARRQSGRGSRRGRGIRVGRGSSE